MNGLGCRKIGDYRTEWERYLTQGRFFDRAQRELVPWL